MIRASDAADCLGLEQVIRLLRCDALRADQVLRNLAQAGYLQIGGDRQGALRWKLTPPGIRLSLARKRKRIDRTKVDAILAEVMQRARMINADPDKLQRIGLRLYGSAIEDREDY